MTTQDTNKDFKPEVIMNVVQRAAVSIVNMQRHNQREKFDYVQFMLPQQMPQLPEQRNIIQQQLVGKPPLSLLEFEQALERIANDKRPRGIIIHCRGFAMPLADLQTLRDILRRFSERGKQIIFFAQMYGLPEYFVASAADQILLQPGGGLMTTGLLQQQVFLKDGLDAIGLEADAVQISPYKGAADRVTRQEPSDEGREMTNWLLDSTYGILVDTIAEGRGISPDDVRTMIDTSPHTDRAALDASYVDGITTEEGLQGHLDAQKVLLWNKADSVLPLRLPKPPGEYVAVLRVAGTIVPGESGKPPTDLPIPLIGGERMGDITVVRQVRNLMKDDNCKALVLYIDSGGGSATASEAMASALDELAKTRPVVVYMGAVAASGGYYIATPADHIVAQPGTITGSIGVLAAKLVNNDALKKLHFNPVTFQRGENAGIYAPIESFSEGERAKVLEGIENTYELFIKRVAEARKMKRESVDAVSRGRVWTGKQAQEHGLVDELGGLYEAVAKARSLAKLPDDAPISIIRQAGKPLPAQLAEQVDPAASLAYYQQNLNALFDGSSQMLMPFTWKPMQ